MIIAVEQEKRQAGFPTEEQEIVLIGDTEGNLSIREYVDMIAMMVRKLDEIDPGKFYKREWGGRNES